MTNNLSNIFLKKGLHCFLFFSLALFLQPLTADGQTGTFSATGSMTTARNGATATLLANGQVLVAGGADDISNTAVASAELYNPATGTFSATGSMNASRFDGQTATLLPNGQVLVAGGLSAGYGDPVPSAELYNPATGTFSATGAMISPRYDSAATLLPNGQVLVVGGCFSNNGTSPCQLVAGAELYNPATGTFSATGSLITARCCYALTLLPNGQALVAGGITSPFDTILASAELYNPATGTFSATGSMTTPRASPAATLLPNGQVLVSGGSIPGSTLTSAELYNPSTGIFSSTGSMATSNESSTLLLDGQVLVAGGSANPGALATAELYDTTTGTFTATGSLITARSNLLATLLLNGQVLVSGGYGDSGPLASAELYNIGTPTNKDECKNNGWMTLARPDGSLFKNQGDCIQFVNTGK
jgi:galactose oxidase-like protein